MTFNISDCVINATGDADAKLELARAIKAVAEATKALAERMTTGSTGILIEGDTIHNYGPERADEPGGDDGEELSDSREAR